MNCIRTKWAALFVLALCISWGHANLAELGFENGLKGWSEPWGYGTLGGHGEGQFVEADESNFVRSGERALRLTVRDDGTANAVAWAGISYQQEVEPGSKIRAGAYLFYSAHDSPPTEGRALAQLRLEYYSDALAKEVIPTHISLSSPFTSTGDSENGAWHLLQVYDRVPEEARTLKYTIMLLSQRPNGEEKKIWVDDAFIETRPPRSRSAYRESRGI